MRSADQFSTDDIRVLLAVARTGRLVTAGELLGIDHTTVRRRINRLESSLGARLLDRGADGWELTALGREVAERAVGIERIVEQVASAASGASDSVRGTVRIIAPDAFGTAFVARALAQVQREHPGIIAELVTSTRPLSLRGSGFDLAVTVGGATSARLPIEPLAEYALRLYASRDYLAGHAPITGLDDLAAHPLVFYVDALLTVRELHLAPHLSGMRVGFGSTNAHAQLHAVKHGAGIGLLHAFLANPEPDLVPVLPRLVDFRLQYSLSTRTESLAVEPVMIVRDAILRDARAHAAELVPPIPR
ncbi:MAG TPA: LysR family transcriptional regulator [Terrimesophilobacter sp.]|nr:LysR family transcriptional regulator [Terrimesophilobacter sp.]